MVVLDGITVVSSGPDTDESSVKTEVIFGAASVNDNNFG